MTCIFQNLALIYEEKSWRQILKYFLECATKPTRGNFRTNVVFSGKEVLLVLKNESEVNQLERERESFSSTTFVPNTFGFNFETKRFKISAFFICVKTSDFESEVFAVLRVKSEVLIVLLLPVIRLGSLFEMVLTCISVCLNWLQQIECLLKYFWWKDWFGLQQPTASYNCPIVKSDSLFHNFFLWNFWPLLWRPLFLFKKKSFEMVKDKVKKLDQGREPWSSGYGRWLMSWRLLVRIPATYTGWTFFTYICCKNCLMFGWKDRT